MLFLVNAPMFVRVDIIRIEAHVSCLAGHEMQLLDLHIFNDQHKFIQKVAMTCLSALLQILKYEQVLIIEQNLLIESII